MTDSNYLLKVEHVTKHFPGVVALDDVSVNVKKGEIHAVVGENGAGKSTLMNILSGVYTADAGQITFQGETISFRDPREAQENGIGMIHQELSVALSLSVMENMFIGRLNSNKLGFVDYKGLYKKCREQLDRLGLNRIDPTTLIRNLSISNMQLVEISKALSLNSSLMIMDEPTSSLTTRETEMLFSIIRNLKERGVSVLFISHRMDEIFEIADIITVLRDGKLISTTPKKAITRMEVISNMVGREFSKAFHREYTTVNESEKPILEVKNLSLKGKFHNISFNLYPGQIIGLTGLVGAGRSELVQSIFGMDRKDSGAIVLNGKEIEIHSPADAIQYGIGLMPEDRKGQGLFLEMSAKENITIANLPKMTAGIFIKNPEEKKQAKSFISKLKIKTPSLDQKVKFLSGGNQQKTILARWLLNKPKVLFLDEPTHGIDVGAKAEIYALMNELANQGVAILLISSELPEIITMADRVIVMHNGEITGKLDHFEANQEEIMKLATKQIESVL